MFQRRRDFRSIEPFSDRPANKARRIKMAIRRLALFLMVVSAWACAGSQPVRLQLPPEARIGMLNVLEPQMTHVAVGALRFDSFTKSYPVDWDLPGYVDRSIQNDLRVHGRYTFIPLAADASGDWKQSVSNGVLSAVNAWLPGDLKAFLERTAEENRLDAIISVSSYDLGSWPDAACFKIGKDPVATKGYGLYTRDRLLSGLADLAPVDQDTATPYANIIVAVFRTRPAALSAYARAACGKSSLPDFTESRGLQALNPGVVRQVKPHIERLAAEATRSALKEAGLLQ